MKRFILFCLSLVMLTAISQNSIAQTNSKDTSSADTTLYDDRTPSEGHDLRLPQSTLDNQEYSRFINKEFSASTVLKKNRNYTKVEVTRIVEKDGSVSSYTVSGTGPESMKNELVRILKLLPSYTPGTRDGKPVRFRMYQPFEFKYN
nr:energy transducer TonB [Pedobacter panaciterrae]